MPNASEFSILVFFIVAVIQKLFNYACKTEVSNVYESPRNWHLLIDTLLHNYGVREIFKQIDFFI